MFHPLESLQQFYSELQTLIVSVTDVKLHRTFTIFHAHIAEIFIYNATTTCSCCHYNVKMTPVHVQQNDKEPLVRLGATYGSRAAGCRTLFFSARKLQIFYFFFFKKPDFHVIFQSALELYFFRLSEGLSQFFLGPLIAFTLFLSSLFTQHYCLQKKSKKTTKRNIKPKNTIHSRRVSETRHWIILLVYELCKACVTKNVSENSPVLDTK